MKVVVLGASVNTARYSNQAVAMLLQYGHTVFPVHPSGRSVQGITTLRSLSEVPTPIDTVSLYLGPQNSSPLIEDILALQPRRIICNPGAENRELEARAKAAGIEVVDGCTLVMLRTGQF